MSEFASWTKHPDFGLQHFSGVGAYRKTYDLSRVSGKRVWIDPGEVRDLAEVVVNGQSVATLWRPPLRVDLSGHVKPSQNQLEIKVINTLVNRLIGDKKVPKDEWTWEIVPADPPWYNEKSKLMPSGLLGPVVLNVSGKNQDATGVAACSEMTIVISSL